MEKKWSNKIRPKVSVDALGQILSRQFFCHIISCLKIEFYQKLVSRKVKLLHQNEFEKNYKTTLKKITKWLRNYMPSLSILKKITFRYTNIKHLSFWFGTKRNSIWFKLSQEEYNCFLHTNNRIYILVKSIGKFLI